uniref:Putative pathogenicity protein n=1 Tax=Fusarium oxysporum TaxID=5507 RepID=R4IYP5_FUSOX|nr:putative pathogenicity protein [Fusarium oxysporum]
MKFSIASTLLLANGIAAMPWSSLNAKQSNGEEITLRIQVSQPSSNHAFSPNHKGVVNVHNYEVCLKVCWPEEPKCPDGWNAKKFGDGDYPCWTCCKKTGDDDDL